MKCADYIIKFLNEKNNKISFGYPGGSILSIYQSINKNNCNHIVARHEQGAIHMAEGYAKSTGEIGVVFATSGPGATNLITGIANAHLDSTPLLIITGQVDIESVGRDAFQEADILGITTPITKHNYLIKTPDDLPYILDEAWDLIKNGRFGPVLIDIPQNILESDIDKYDKLPCFKNIYVQNKISEKTLKSIFTLLNKAKKPLIIAGGGTLTNKKTSVLINDLIKKHSIPGVTTLMGIGSLTKENSLGFIGVQGNKEANDALNNSDFIISFGCRFSDRVIKNPEQFIRNKKIVQVDIDSAELSKSFRADIEVLSQAYDFLNQFSDYLNKNQLSNYSNWFKECYKEKKHSISKSFSCEMIVEYINKINNNYITVTDVGHHQMIYARNNSINSPSKFITSGGLGAMGFGLPASIGASILNKDKVFLFVGDGGFQMTFQELAIVRKFNLPIKIFLINDCSLKLVDQLQKLNYNEDNKFYNLDYNPNFSILAQAYDIKCINIKSQNELKIIDTYIKDSNPYVFNFILENQEE